MTGTLGELTQAVITSQTQADTGDERAYPEPAVEMLNDAVSEVQKQYPALALNLEQIPAHL